MRMDAKIQKLLGWATLKSSKYQYRAILIFFLLGITIYIFENSVTISLLERPPEVSYFNSTQGKNVTGSLTYDICNSKYDIIKEYRYSWVSRWNIFCDEFKVGFMGFSNYFGIFISSLLSPILSNFISGRILTIFSTLMFIATWIPICFTWNYYIFLSVLMLNNAFSGIAIQSWLVIISDIAPNNHRSKFISFFLCAIAVSGLLYDLVFYLFGNLEIIFVSSGIFTFLILFLFVLCIYESPRYHLRKCSVIKCIRSLKKIAKSNGSLDEFEVKIRESKYLNIIKELCNDLDDDYDILYASEIKTWVEDEKLEESIRRKYKTIYIGRESVRSRVEETIQEIEINYATQDSACDWLRYSSVRTPFIIFSLLFIFVSFIEVGFTMKMKSLSPNIFIDHALLSVGQLFMDFIVGFIIEIKGIGRKNSSIFVNVVSIICLVVVIFLNWEDHINRIPLLIMKQWSAGFYTIWYTYSLEHYPSSLRNLGLAGHLFGADISGMVAPLVVEWLKPIQAYIIFAVFFAIDWLLVLGLKETMGKPLVSTIIEKSQQKVLSEEKKDLSIFPGKTIDEEVNEDDDEEVEKRNVNLEKNNTSNISNSSNGEGDSHFHLWSPFI